MTNFNFKLFKSLNESEYKELYTPKRTLTEATTDINEVAEEYKKAYHIDLDWNRVPCVIARDKFLSGWGGAEGKTHYQVVLCGDSTEAANIEANMRSLGREEGLANIRRDFGVHLSSRVSKAYVVGRYASAWNNLSKSWYESRFDSGKTEDEINQEKDAQEARRQEKLRQKEQQTNESEKLDEWKDGGSTNQYAITFYANSNLSEEDLETRTQEVVSVLEDDEMIERPIKDIKVQKISEINKRLPENSLKEHIENINDNPTYLKIVNFIDNIIYSEEDEDRKQICTQLKKDMNVFGNLEESEKLKEEYSEKLGGDPEDFISDVELILNKLKEIDSTKLGTHLAQEIVEQFIETCDSQISMAKSRFLGESDDIEEFKKKYKKSFDNWKKENPQASDKEIVDILKAKQYNGELNEDEDTVHKMKDCTDDVEVIMALEGDTLELDDMEDWNRLKEIARGLAGSQGFYGRLLANMEEVEEEDLEFPIYL